MSHLFSLWVLLSAALLLQGCAAMMGLDYSKLKTSGDFFDKYTVFSVTQTTTEPMKLSEWNRSYSVVDLSKDPVSAHCSGFAHWAPNELIDVKVPMTLRIFALGQLEHNVVVVDPQGKVICGEFAEGQNPAEITIKNAMPGRYQIRVGSRALNTKELGLQYSSGPAVIYTGEPMVIYVENVSDGNPFRFDAVKLSDAHSMAREEARAKLDADIKREEEKLLDQRRRERREFRQSLSEFAAVTGQAFSEVAQDRLTQAQRLQEESNRRAANQTQPIPKVTAPVRSASQAQPPRAVASQPRTPVQNFQPSAREQIAQSAAVQRPTSNSGATSTSQSQAPKTEPNIRWPEGLVVCPRPGGGKVPRMMGASNCYGPHGSAFIDRVAGDINMAEVNRACGSTAREIGWIEDHRVFGCGFGVNPTKSSQIPHYDQAERRGINVPNRRSYSCPANQSGNCRN